MKGSVSHQISSFIEKEMYQYVLSFYENSISYLEKGRSKSFEASKEINMSIMHVSHFYENLEK